MHYLLLSIQYIVEQTEGFSYLAMIDRNVSLVAYVFLRLHVAVCHEINTDECVLQMIQITYIIAA